MIKFLRFVKTSSSVVTRKGEQEFYDGGLCGCGKKKEGKKGWVVIPSNEDLMSFHGFITARALPV